MCFTFRKTTGENANVKSGRTPDERNQRRTRVVVFRIPPRLAATLLIEQNDQWQNDKRYLPESNDRPAKNVIYRKLLHNPK